MSVTAGFEEYLAEIYRLGGREAAVPLSLLAGQMRYSAASVNEMIRRMEERDLVRYAPYQGVLLTDEGICLALGMLRRHRLWERFLTDLLHLSWDVVHEQACKLEHAASDEVTERLAELLNYPDRCPHGRPVPPPDCRSVEHAQAVSLTSLPPGRSGQVAFIAREEPDLLRYVESLGLCLDVSVTVRQVAPFDGLLTLDVQGAGTQVIGPNIAALVFVNPDESNAN